MFGKLGLSAVPYEDPIVMGAVGGSILLAVVILALITYYRKWTILWKEWLTSVDHKRIGINFLVTILKMCAPGMTLMRMPIFVWTVLCTAVLMVLSFPVLTVALAMLTLDRYLGMHFFTNSLGGNMMMYTNLFWIWGHPEVYIVVLPAFGIFSEVVATFSGKPLFGYTSMVFATMAIMVLSFSGWLPSAPWACLSR